MGSKGTGGDEPQAYRSKSSKSLTAKVSGRILPSRKTVKFTESLRGRDRLANCPRT